MCLERSSQVSRWKVLEPGTGILGRNPNSTGKLLYHPGLATLGSRFPEASPVFCATRHPRHRRAHRTDGQPPSLSEPAVRNQGDYVSQGTFGHVWSHLGLSQMGGM